MFHTMPDNATVETVAAHFGVPEDKVLFLEDIGFSDPRRDRRKEKDVNPAPTHAYTFYRVLLVGGHLTAYSRVTEV